MGNLCISSGAIAAGRAIRRRERLIDDPAYGARTASAFGAASKTAIDLARRPHGAFGRNGTDLMVRNDVARTHDHDRTPGSAAHPAFLFMLSSESASDPNDDVSLPLYGGTSQAL